MSEHVVASVPYCAEMARRALADVTTYRDKESEVDAGWWLHTLHGVPVDPEWPESVRHALRRCR
jgi:hypothetical protein